MKKRNCEFAKLDGKITEKFGTREAFACALGISKNSVCNKMQGKYNWKTQEIKKACELLDIPRTDIEKYFF